MENFRPTLEILYANARAVGMSGPEIALVFKKELYSRRGTHDFLISHGYRVVFANDNQMRGLFISEKPDSTSDLVFIFWPLWK